MSETCGAIRALLSAFHDGELSPSESTRVQQHVTSCVDCREALERYGAIGEAVSAQAILRTDEEWEALATRVDRAVEREGYAGTAARPPRRRFFPLRPGLAFGSAGTLLAALLVVLLRPYWNEMGGPAAPAPAPESAETAPGGSGRLAGEGADPDRAVEGKALGFTESREQAPPERHAPVVAEEPSSLREVPPSSGGRAAPQDAPLRQLEEKRSVTLQDRRERAAVRGLASEPAARAMPVPDQEGRSLQGPSLEELTARALESGDEEDLLEAAGAWDARSAASPEDLVALARRVELRARLVEIDAARHCEDARESARDYRSRADGEADSAASEAVRRIREVCSP